VDANAAGYAEYATVPAAQAFAIPVALDWLQAAALPEVWLTAYQLLHFVGEVQKGDVVLIHAGASGVGTAAIQLAALAGATSIVTAGSQAKIDAAVKYGASAGFNRNDGDWAPKVKDHTGGKGVNLVLDCVGGSYWQQNSDVLAMDSRCVGNCFPVGCKWAALGRVLWVP